MNTYRLTTDKTWAQTLDDLDDTFRKWGVRTWSVEPSHPGRRATNRYQSLDERTVTLRYTCNGDAVVLTMGKQDRAVDNLRVLYLATEALRMNEARGIAEVVASAYAQLPPPGQTTPLEQPATDPYAVLGVTRDAPLSVIEAAWKARLKQAHPDAGGTAAAAAQVNVAMETIRKERT